MKKTTQYLLSALTGISVAFLFGCGQNSNTTSTSAQSEDHTEHQHDGGDQVMAMPSEDGASTEVKPYPLEVCIVSGEKLGSMGEPPKIEHDGQEIKFCCKDCIGTFKDDPDKYMTALSKAISAK